MATFPLFVFCCFLHWKIPSFSTGIICHHGWNHRHSPLNWLQAWEIARENGRQRAFPCIKRGLNEVIEPENQQVTNPQGVMKIFPGFLSLEAKIMLVKKFLKKKEKIFRIGHNWAGCGIWGPHYSSTLCIFWNWNNRKFSESIYFSSQKDRGAPRWVSCTYARQGEQFNWACSGGFHCELNHPHPHHPHPLLLIDVQFQMAFILRHMCFGLYPEWIIC